MGTFQFRDVTRIVGFGFRTIHSAKLTVIFLVPGCVMAAARHNRPTIIVYGGTMQAGTRKIDCPPLGLKAGDPVNIGEMFETWGEVS